MKAIGHILQCENDCGNAIEVLDEKAWCAKCLPAARQESREMIVRDLAAFSPTRESVDMGAIRRSCLFCAWDEQREVHAATCLWLRACAFASPPSKGSR